MKNASLVYDTKREVVRRRRNAAVLAAAAAMSLTT
jgi:hypothetical protein